MRLNLVAFTFSPVFLIAALVAPPGTHQTLVPDSRQHSRVETFQISADTLIDLPSGIAFDSAGYAYVANQGGPSGYSVTVYPPKANGNVSPARTIAGSLTGLNFPGGIAFDTSGYAYVVNQAPASAPSVVVYAPGANGNVAPARSIAGSLTGIGAPYGIAVDSGGYVYVANTGFAGFTSITVYAPGASGNVAPVRTIAGSATGLNQPYGVAVDSAGYTYVANAQDDGGNASVTVYAPGANGNAAPVRTIAGAATGLSFCDAIAVDASGHVYVANLNGNPYSVTVYAAGANGNVPPLREITGPNTLLQYPSGLALDRRGELYVAQFFSNGVTAYTRRASGNATPRRALATVGSFAIPPLNGLSGRYTYWYVPGSVQLSVQSWWQTSGNPPPPSNGGTIVAYSLVQGSLPTPGPFSPTDKSSIISYGLLDPAKTYSIAVFGTGCTAWYAGTVLRCTKSCSSKRTACGCCRTAVVEFSLADIGSPTNGTLTFPSPLSTIQGTTPIYVELVENPTFFQRRLQPFRDWNAASAVPAGTLEWLAAISRGRCPNAAPLTRRPASLYVT